MDDGQREVERAAYRERMSPRAYAQRLLDILMEAVT
jgi:hypothetical protein